MSVPSRIEPQIRLSHLHFQTRRLENGSKIDLSASPYPSRPARDQGGHARYQSLSDVGPAPYLLHSVHPLSSPSPNDRNLSLLRQRPIIHPPPPGPKPPPESKPLKPRPDIAMPPPIYQQIPQHALHERTEHLIPHRHPQDLQIRFAVADAREVGLFEAHVREGWERRAPRQRGENRCGNFIVIVIVVGVVGGAVAAG